MRTTTQRSMAGRVAILTVAAGIVMLLWPLASPLADPPPWAPAHDYRDTQKGQGGPDADRGRTGTAMPFGLDQGVCNRELIDAAPGGAPVGVAGSPMGRRSGKSAAAVSGASPGVLIGGDIGRSMDEADHACVSQVLERVPDRQPIAWQNPDRRSYRVTPMLTYKARGGHYCREYQAQAMIGGRAQTAYGTACRQPDGTWQKQPERNWQAQPDSWQTTN